MKTIKILALFSAAVLLTLATSCSSKKTTKEAQKSVPVKTMTVKTESIIRNIDYTATLIPFKEVYLAPVSPGKIEKINVEIGDEVTKGQIVAIMDRSNLESAHINLLNLETNFKRLETLRKTNTVAAQQYDEVKTAYEAAKVSYQFLLDNTDLKAPFSGVITGKYFEDQDNFSGAPNTQAGKAAIVTIEQINRLKALIGISASYFPQIEEGMKVDITCDVYPGETFKGKIYRKYPTIDGATKTFTVEILIYNNDLKLRPGMFAKARLNLGKGEAIMVPTIALVKQTGTDDMYLFINKNNVAIKQPVKTGRVIDDKTEIINGINDGDEIIVTGQNKLQNKMPITIIK